MKKSILIIIYTLMYGIAAGLLIIGQHLLKASIKFHKLSDYELKMAADLDIRWFIGPYAIALILAAIVLIVINTYTIYKSRQKNPLS